MGQLDGKVAIITGAARGQGAAEAARFVEEGAAVILTDVLDEAGVATADALGDATRFVHHDVSDEAGWACAVQTALDVFGGVDVLVNNAAIHHIVTIEHESVEDFDRVVAVNLRGTFLGIRSVIEPMRARGGGSIVNISSLAGIQPLFGHAAYSSSKFGVTGLTKVAALELGPSQIRVNSLHPGAIETEMLTKIAPVDPEMFRNHPLGRVGTVDDVARVVVFLASDASAFVTGADLRVDGGLGCGTLRG